MRNRVVTLLFLQVLFLPVLALGQSSRALVLKQRIALPNVNGRIDHLSVDLKGQRVFVAAIDNHTLEVVDVRTGRRVHTIANLVRPQGVYYDASTNRLFVACGGDTRLNNGTLKIFDGTTFRLLRTVKLGSDADDVRYDARTKQVLVGFGGQKFVSGKPVFGQGDGAIAVFDLSGKRVADIPTDAHPEAFELEKSGTRVFINVPDKHEIEVADLVSHKVLAHWPVTACTDNFPMTLDEPHHRLFVACRIPARLLVFNTQTGKRVAELPAVSSDDIYYDASKGRIYVLGNPTETDARPNEPCFVDVFQQKDPDHYVRIGRYPTGNGAWTGLFVPEWGELFTVARHKGAQSAALLEYKTQ